MSRIKARTFSNSAVFIVCWTKGTRYKSEGTPGVIVTGGRMVDSTPGVPVYNGYHNSGVFGSAPQLSLLPRILSSNISTRGGGEW